MRMLDPTSIADPDRYGPEDIKGLFLRRFRTSPAVKTALRSRVKPRVTTKLDFTPSPQEETLYDALAGLDLCEDRGAKKGQRLFKTTLEKALFSSPAAFMETGGTGSRRCGRPAAKNRRPTPAHSRRCCRSPRPSTNVHSRSIAASCRF